MELLQQAEQFIFTLFKDKLSPEYIYHDFSHTLRVVQAVTVLAAGEQLSEEETLELKLAAWFHDAGYVYGCENHEQNSCLILREFLSVRSHTVNISKVEQIIMSTVITAVPETLQQKCLRDADFVHFTFDNYTEYCELLRKEFTVICDKYFTDTQWNEENIRMLSRKHHYYTDYAKKNWQPLKETVLLQLYKQAEKLKNNERITGKELKKKKLEKIERPERGIDTMFRVTLNNHTQLSAIADSKANILLSVNTILVSIVLTVIIPKLDSPKNAHLIIPTFILLIFSVITIIFTILSTKPKVSSGTFTDTDIKNRTVNLLFFGNFHQMPLNRYTDAMEEMMQNREHLYDNLIKDLYYLGLVLDKKYKLLRTTYTIFMIGIIVSVSAYILAFINL